MIPKEEARALLERALANEIGVGVRVEDPKAYRHEIYMAKKEFNDPRYDNLTFLLPQGNEWVYIVRKDAEGPLP